MKKLSVVLGFLFLAQLAQAAPIYANLIQPKATRNLTKLEPKLVLKNIISSSITFNSQSATLNITLNVPCAKGKICPRVARVEKLQYSLSITEVRENECDTTYTAQTLKAFFPKQIITIVDRTNSTCPTTMELPYSAGDVELKIVDFNNKTDKNVEGSLVFKVKDSFIRALNR